MATIHNQRYYKDIRKDLRNSPTKAEELLWIKLKKNQIGYKFRRQHSIGHFIIDFYCPQVQLAIEIDGETHDDQKVLLKDKEKESYLKKEYIHLKRISAMDVKENVEGVVLKIKEWCDDLKSTS